VHNDLLRSGRTGAKSKERAYSVSISKETNSRVDARALEDLYQCESKSTGSCNNHGNIN
jgi:hypothetical protein